MVGDVAAVFGRMPLANPVDWDCGGIWNAHSHTLAPARANAASSPQPLRNAAACRSRRSTRPEGQLAAGCHAQMPVALLLRCGDTPSSIISRWPEPPVSEPPLRCAARLAPYLTCSRIEFLSLTLFLERLGLVPGFLPVLSAFSESRLVGRAVVNLSPKSWRNWSARPEFGTVRGRGIPTFLSLQTALLFVLHRPRCEGRLDFGCGEVWWPATDAGPPWKSIPDGRDQSARKGPSSPVDSAGCSKISAASRPPGSSSLRLGTATR